MQKNLNNAKKLKNGKTYFLVYPYCTQVYWKEKNMDLWDGISVIISLNMTLKFQKNKYFIF